MTEPIQVYDGDGHAPFLSDELYRYLRKIHEFDWNVYDMVITNMDAHRIAKFSNPSQETRKGMVKLRDTIAEIQGQGFPNRPTISMKIKARIDGKSWARVETIQSIDIAMNDHRTIVTMRWNLP